MATTKARKGIKRNATAKPVSSVKAKTDALVLKVFNFIKPGKVFTTNGIMSGLKLNRSPVISALAKLIKGYNGNRLYAGGVNRTRVYARTKDVLAKHFKVMPKTTTKRTARKATKRTTATAAAA